MDGSAFDRLTRAFDAAGSSRRRILALISGLSLAGLVAHGERQAEAVAQGRKRHRSHAHHQHRHHTTQRRKMQRNTTHSEACIPTGRRCPSKKPRGQKGKRLGCNECCQGVSHTQTDGKRYCGCQLNGEACTTTTASSCCSGFCNGTTCQAASCSAARPCPPCQTCNTASGQCEPLPGGTPCCVGGNPVVCPPSDQCHDAGTCDPTTGTCSNPAKPDGTGCNDGDLCTQTDTCQGGVCVGANPVLCTPLDQCHVAGTCIPATGQCTNPAKPNGTACDDRNACTQTDTCQHGVCVGANPVVCNAPDLCHVATGASCDPATGSCSYPNAADGTICGTQSEPGGGTIRCCNGTCLDPNCVPSGDVSGTTCPDCANGLNCCAHRGVVCQNVNPCFCVFAEDPGDSCGSDHDCDQAGAASACICGTCRVPPTP